MTGSIKEKVLDAIKILNKMVDEYDSSNNLHFYKLVEIKKYNNDFKTILKRAVLMSTKEIFNEEELNNIKMEITTVERKIENITTRAN